jgi:hypothetical protein
MTYCLCQPRAAEPCVIRNYRPEAHTYMMRLPQRYLVKDRPLVLALQANGLVARMGARVVPTALGIRIFMSQFRFCCTWPDRWVDRCVELAARVWFDPCDARPDTWRPAPGSVAFRNPCTL